MCFVFAEHKFFIVQWATYSVEPGEMGLLQISLANTEDAILKTEVLYKL